jgi:hypothetical protein
LTTGAQITDGANVVFDTNEAISTNIWLNTLDVTPPTSTITALPATEIAASGQTTNFNVTWSGSDAGSGIATYNIYSSDTGAPYTLWQNAVTTTSASFTGTVGHTYSFYSISTDNAGNVQASKTTPDTTTSVVSVFTTTTTLTSSVTTAQVGTSIVLTATVTPSSGGGVPTGSIDFVDGTNQISSGSLNSAGVATYTSAALSIGTHSIAAVYRGDANNAASTSASVSIVITAIPDFSIALTPTSGSVTPAGSVTTSITITPLNGFAQTVALSCSNLPADATCSINPASITPNGTSDSTAMVTIRTDGSSAAALRRTADPLHGHGERTALISFGAIIFATFSMLRRRRLSTWGVTLLMAGLLLASYGLSGCASPHASTPPGTYSVTISGVAGTDSHTATYTLTIQ